MKMSHKKKLLDAEAAGDDDMHHADDKKDKKKSGCCSTPGFYDEFMRPCWAEFIGAILFTFISGMAAMTAEISTMAVGGGFIIIVLAIMFTPISGGHFNPAITLAVLITGNITPVKALFYVLFQLVGSIAGAAIVLGLADNITYDNQFGGVPMVIGSLTIVEALALEAVLGFILVLVYLVSQVDEQSLLAPLAHGLVYLVGLFVSIPQTGGVINPIRSFGPSVIYSAETIDHWDEQWIYYVSSAAGAALAAIVYKVHLASDKKRWNCTETKKSA